MQKIIFFRFDIHKKSKKRQLMGLARRLFAKPYFMRQLHKFHIQITDTKKTSIPFDLNFIYKTMPMRHS